jgi:hypothetical protein
MIVDAGRREIYIGVEEFVDQRANRVRLRQRLQLVPELEVLQNVLDVGREAVEVILEIGEELLLATARLEVAQRELRRVIEGLPGSITQCQRSREIPYLVIV